MNEEFEIWARTRGMDLEYRNIPGVGKFYECPRTLLALEAWEACQQIKLSKSPVIILPQINPEMFNEDVLFGFEKARNAAKAKLKALGFEVSA